MPYRKGDWYFLTHHGTDDRSGRNMSLLRVKWVEGWPILGEVGPDTIGWMVWLGKKPVEGLIVTPLTYNEFVTSTLAEQ